MAKGLIERPYNTLSKKLDMLLAIGDLKRYTFKSNPDIFKEFFEWYQHPEKAIVYEFKAFDDKLHHDFVRIDTELKEFIHNVLYQLQIIHD